MAWRVSIADATLASPQRLDMWESWPCVFNVSIADATLASPQLPEAPSMSKAFVCFNRRRDACFPATRVGYRVPFRVSQGFNRRRDACFPATRWVRSQRCRYYHVSIADATLASPQRHSLHTHPASGFRVSIADATLASPQLDTVTQEGRIIPVSFNRRRDACFPATYEDEDTYTITGVGFNRRRDACFPARMVYALQMCLQGSFNRRRDACFPATPLALRWWPSLLIVSIADATLASPQRQAGFTFIAAFMGFNRRRDACFPATWKKMALLQIVVLFQSQTRRLLPRNASEWYLQAHPY